MPWNELLILTPLVFAVVVLVVVIAQVIARRRRRRLIPAPAPAPASFDVEDIAGDPRKIQVGQALDYLGERYFVRGTLHLREAGRRWQEHVIDDGEGGEGRLSVQENPGLHIVIWAGYEPMTPGEKSIVVEGVEYQKEKQGSAAYTGEGATGLVASGKSGKMEYSDYVAAGGLRFLSFTRFDSGVWQTALGERLPRGALSLLP